MVAPENVGIFWDFENVSHQCSRLTGYALANNIRDLAFDYGRVNVFKAYLEIVANSPKAATFRSQLQCSGVSLTDCPHNDRKEGVWRNSQLRLHNELNSLKWRII